VAIAHSAAAEIEEDVTAPDLFVTIRFQESTETGRASSCLQMGGASQLQGLDEAARLAVTRDCASAVWADWHWERAVSLAEGGGGGVSLVHTMSPRDVASIAQEGGPRAEQWDICVASSSSRSDSDSAPERATGHVRGVITLFQLKEAETEAVAVAAGPPAGERRPRDHDAALPPSSPAPGPDPGLQRHSEGAALSFSGGTQVARQQNRQVHTAAGPVVSAVTPGAVDIYVDLPVDAEANASLCDSSINQTFATIGQCNFRSAVASCEALLTAPATTLCSVHLPALSDIAMAPELGEMLVQDAMMEGTLSIIGNGCYISPNATAASSTRFMRVDGNDKFSFRMSNMSLYQFGGLTIDGGAMYLRNLLSEDASSIEDVDFVGNTGSNGGALYVSQCMHITLTSNIFTNNTADDGGGGLFVERNVVDMTLSFCTFSNNTADDGGGVYVLSGNDELSFIASTFSGNTAGNDGGGLHVFRDNNHLEVTSCAFSENTAANDGGGVHVIRDNDDMALTSVTFSDNTAANYGGGMDVNSGNDGMSLTSCSFKENTVAVDGGGLFINSANFNTTLASCIFSGNAATDGGGLFVFSDNDNMTLTSCSFTENTASYYGGGMDVYSENNDMSFASCIFTENTAGYGGGVALYSGNEGMTLTSCSFSGNSASNDGGGMFLYSDNDRTALTSCNFTENTAAVDGGGMYVHSANYLMALTSCAFSWNSAEHDGGALDVYGDNQHMRFSFCTFLENTAAYGGGLYANTGNDDLTLTSCAFFKNSVHLDGGGIFMNSDNYDVLLESCVFAENAAEGHGGGLYLSSNNWDMQQVNVTFAGNVAANGNGGALAMAFYNFNMAVSESMFIDNVAGVAGK
jgi:hypothetical protein